MSCSILDFGSRSIKIYTADHSHNIELHSKINWRALERARHGHYEEISDDLNRLALVLVKLPRPIHGIGTAFARRHPDLEKYTVDFCSNNEIRYETISQEREVSLIKKAFSNVQEEADIFNVGGGSIQICHAQGDTTLLKFGISDLNERYLLDQHPTKRKVSECVDWISHQLPVSSNTFIYTGGEATYLRSVGVVLGDGNRCDADQFRQTSQQLARLSSSELNSLSPYGDGWMCGAIASNCIVLAALQRSNSDHFIASDLNVADGLIASFAEEKDECLHADF